MPNHLKRTGLQWTGSVDGPFPARTLTNCDEINRLMEAQSVEKVGALNELLAAVEKVFGKLKKPQRTKLEAAFVSTITVLAGKAWMHGAKAAQADRSNRSAGQRKQSRDRQICELMAAMTTRKKDRLQVELAAVEVSVMNNADGTPMFTGRGNKRLTEDGVLTVWRRHRPKAFRRNRPK